MDIERAFRVKHPHVPARLYKYRQFTEYHLNALTKDVLWLSSPDKLNDPYEAQVSFDVDRFIIDDQSVDDFLKQSEEVKKAIEAGKYWRPSKPLRPIKSGVWLQRTVSTLLQSSDLPDKEAFALFLEQWGKEQALAIVNSMSQWLRECLSVLSLSATANSKLLWAHYSNSHKGFAIEYDFAALPYNDLRRRICFPVFYTTKPRDATRYFAKPGEPMNNQFGYYTSLVKQVDWAYEQEWRIVMGIGPENTNREIPMPKPSAVFLGSQVSSSDEETMQKLCKARSIPLKRMAQKPGTFELEPIQVALD